MGLLEADVNPAFDPAAVELAPALKDGGGVDAPPGPDPGDVAARPFVSPAPEGEGDVDAPPNANPRMVRTSCNLIWSARPSGNSLQLQSHTGEFHLQDGTGPIGCATAPQMS